MKPTRIQLIAAAAGVLVVYAVAQLINWPGWVMIGVSVILLVGLAVWRGATGNDSSSAVARPGPEVPAFNGLPAAAPATEAVAPTSRTIAAVRLPSASADYQFELSATVCWSESSAAGRHADPGSIAVDAVLTRARSICVLQGPGDVGWVGHRLAALLGEPGLDETGQLQVWATGVRLEVPKEDREHLEAVSGAGRLEQTMRLQRRLELETRAYLKDDVFATIGSAASWWLAWNPGRVEKCVSLLGDLRQLSNAITGNPSIDDELESFSAEQPSPYGRPVIFASTATGPTEPPAAFAFDDAVAKLLEGHDEPQRSLKADSLADLEARFNRPAQAQRIRDLHDVAPITPTPVQTESAGPGAADVTQPLDEASTQDYREKFSSE